VHTKFEVCNNGHYRNIEEMPKSKSRSLWLRPFDLFFTAYFQLIAVYLLAKFEPVALAVWEIFTEFHKFISRSPKLDHVPFDLVFYMPSKLLIVVCAHQTWNWVIGSFASSFMPGSPGHHFDPVWDPSFSGFRKNAQNAKRTLEMLKWQKVIVRCLLLDWNHLMSVHAMNFYFYLCLLKILWHPYT